jgi:hypothetical protein
VVRETRPPNDAIRDWAEDEVPNKIHQMAAMPTKVLSSACFMIARFRTRRRTRMHIQERCVGQKWMPAEGFQSAGKGVRGLPVRARDYTLETAIALLPPGRSPVPKARPVSCKETHY